MKITQTVRDNVSHVSRQPSRHYLGHDIRLKDIGYSLLKIIVQKLLCQVRVCHFPILHAIALCTFSLSHYLHLHFTNPLSISFFPISFLAIFSLLTYGPRCCVMSTLSFPALRVGLSQNVATASDLFLVPG